MLLSLFYLSLNSERTCIRNNRPPCSLSKITFCFGDFCSNYRAQMTFSRRLCYQSLTFENSSLSAAWKIKLPVWRCIVREFYSQWLPSFFSFRFLLPFDAAPTNRYGIWCHLQVSNIIVQDSFLVISLLTKAFGFDISQPNLNFSYWFLAEMLALDQTFQCFFWNFRNSIGSWRGHRNVFAFFGPRLDPD